MVILNSCGKNVMGKKTMARKKPMLSLRHMSG